MSDVAIEEIMEAQRPAVLKRLLLRELRRLRTEVGLTQKQVADRLRWSLSKVIRIESGQVTVGFTDLDALLRLYNLSDEEKRASLVQALEGSRPGYWTDYVRKGYIDHSGERFIGDEATARLIRQFEPELIPGLLQTPDYARAILRDVHGRREDAIEAIVEIRAIRQEILARESPPEMFFVVGQAAVATEVGGPDVMRRQREHLVNLNEHPKISVQVVPFTAGAHPGMRGSFAVFEFPDDKDENVLYLESPADFMTREDPAETTRYIETFFGLEAIAWPAAELADRLKLQSIG
jgi:transcriptional regulator with XRE-family HTH domain